MVDGPVLTWDAYAAQVREAAGALAGLGLERGDVVALWLANRPEFHVADAAAMHLGLVSASLYPDSPRSLAERLIADAGARLLITEGAFVDAAIAIRDARTTPLEHIVLVEGDAPEALGWDELLEFAPAGFDFDSAWHSVRPDDVATLVYTPGTSGPPKGIALTHANITAQTTALMDRLQLPAALRTVAAGPMAHILERLGAHFLPMFGGWQVTCCPDPAQAPAVIAAERPGYLSAFPALWERLRERLLADAPAEELAALDAAVERVRAGAGPQDAGPQRSARSRVGLDALEVAIAGGAPCPPELVTFWHACGVPLAELYGLSEATGAVAVAAPAGVRVGTAGPPLPGCAVRIGADGEILVRGPGVMRDAGEWLRTGDTGELTEDGHLRVIGGPAAVEAELACGTQLIGQACVLGDRQDRVALLTLDPLQARAYARASGLPDAGLARLARSRRLVEAVQAEVAAVNRRLPHGDQVRRFLLLGDRWAPGSAELTATLRPRRAAVADGMRARSKR